LPSRALRGRIASQQISCFKGPSNMIDKSTSTPLYEQVKRLIMADLKSRSYADDRYLPSESKLCELYSVSRITLRRAVSELCDEGLLQKVHGKGTMATVPKVKQTLVSLTGFTEAMQSLGHSVHFRILDPVPNLGLDTVRSKLDAAVDAQIVSIRRLLLVDDHPLTIEQLFFLEDRYGDTVTLVKNGGSFYDALKNLYKEHPAEAERSINVGFPSQDEATLLACPVSQTVYRIEKTVFGRHRNAISFSILTTPTDRVTYMLNG
jgi:GntR family frlABCD operon transcriptional regulator